MGTSRQASRLLASVLPSNLLPWVYRLLIGSDCVSLCLHRVARDRRPQNPYPSATIEHDKLVKILEAIHVIHSIRDSKIILSFDDGYQDAFDFYYQVHENFPNVQWHYFVCPRKVVDREAFFWDLYEADEPSISYRDFIAEFSKLSSVDKRVRLSNLGDDKRFLMVNTDQLVEMAQKENVVIGNHSNSHDNFAEMTEDAAESELLSSIESFSKILPSTDHFAFPFGTPTIQFSLQNLNLVRQHSHYKVWSTASYSFRKESLKAGQLLPRIVVDGTWTWKEIVIFIGLRALVTRMQRILGGGQSKFDQKWNSR